MMTIERRIDYLQNQILELATWPNQEKLKARTDWIKAEIAALNWALQIVKQAGSNGETGSANIT